MTDLEQYLTSKEDAGASPVELRVLGVKAASQYIQEKRPLNESIADMAKEGGLGLEQVRRVVEYANNETFNRLFRAGYDKNITFPMADASAVLQTAETVKTASAKAPPLPKRKYIPGQEYVNLDAAFGASDAQMEKTAGLTDSERHTKSLEFVDLNREKANLEAMLEITADSFMIKLNGLKDKCKEASNSGYEPSTIGAAIELANPSDGLLGVIKTDFGDAVDFGHMKKLSMGGMELMPGNPVTGLTQDLEGISGKLVTTQQAIQQVQIAMSSLLGILRGPAPGSAMANTVFNPGGMGSQPAPPPSAEGAAPQGGPQAAPPQGAPPQGGPPEGAGGPPPSPPGQGGLGQLFGGGR
jgi:hypothetical protein